MSFMEKHRPTLRMGNRMNEKSLEQKVQYLLDRIEIQDVIARYAAGQDNHQGDDHRILVEWDQTFTPDAVVDFTQAGPGFGKFSYRELAKVMRGDEDSKGSMNASFQKWQHMLGLPLVEVHGDAAVARTDLLATHVGRTNVGTPWHLFDACTFHDELVRTEHGWRIKYRRLEVHYVEIIETIRHPKSVEDLIGK
jgi:hypothetical protein